MVLRFCAEPGHLETPHVCLLPEGLTKARAGGELQATAPTGRTRVTLTGTRHLAPLVMARKSPEAGLATRTRVTCASENATQGISGITPNIPWAHLAFALTAQVLETEGPSRSIEKPEGQHGRGRSRRR